MRYLKEAVPVLFVLLCVMLTESCSTASQQTANQNTQKTPTQVESAQAAASQSLSAFRGLVTADNYKEMGFDSPNEVSSAALGEPIQVFTVALDRLSEYQQGTDPDQLLVDANRVIFPVNVKDEVRSSIVVESAGGKWSTTSYGAPNLVKLLAKTRRSGSEAGKSPLSSFFAVQVPALNLYFIGSRVDNKLMLTPVLDDTSYNFRAGATMPATDVFVSLAAAAKRHSGFPT